MGWDFPLAQPVDQSTARHTRSTKPMAKKNRIGPAQPFVTISSVSHWLSMGLNMCLLALRHLPLCKLVFKGEFYLRVHIIKCVYDQSTAHHTRSTKPMANKNRIGPA